MNYLDISDQSLTARTLAGDKEAFTTLMRRHKVWLYNFVRRYLSDPDEAHDVVQESFASAWNALSRYDPQRDFSIWLRSIALNKCRDRARYQATRRFLLPWGGSSPETVSADPLTGPDETLMQKELVGVVQRAINDLPDVLKDSIILTALEGLSHAEAAAVLGVTAKTVEGRVSRGRKLLSSTLHCGLLGGDHHHDHDDDEC